ncbi:MAG: hypothetical protein AAGA62_15445, partial [Bacteroidota bacterium]
RDNFGNYQISFVAPEPIDQFVITSACCQIESPDDERLTYYGVDNLSLVEAAPLPLNNSLQISAVDCNAPLSICTQTTTTASYQWYREGVAVVGATSSCLTLLEGAPDGTTFQVWIQTPDNCVILDTTLSRGCTITAEICNNGIDDDGDGLIDFNDPDCTCSAPPRSLAVVERYCPTAISLSVVPRDNEVVQWYYNGIPLTSAVGNALQLTEAADLMGQYFAVITDPISGNCHRSEVFQPTPPAALSFTSIISPPNCFNGSDGSITTSLSSADTSEYTFNWRTEAGETISQLPNANSLSAGSYQLVLTNKDGCSGTFNFDLPNQLPPSVILRIEYDSCGQDDNGGILNLNVLNLPPPFLHTYANVLGGDTLTSSSNRFFLPDGEYYGFTIDANNCRVDWGPVSVVRPAGASLQISASAQVVSLGASIDLSATTSADFLGWAPA